VVNHFKNTNSMITKDTHPVSFKMFGSYALQHVRTSSPNIPEEVISAFPIDNILNMAIASRGSAVYDFLDAQGIIVSVWNPSNGWKYRVADDFPMEGSAGSRIEAEQKAFLEAFTRLEKKNKQI